MPRGGYRPGSGRKPSSISIRSRELAARAMSDGETPLEVMRDNMRFYHRSRRSTRQAFGRGCTAAEVTEGADVELRADVIEAVRDVLTLGKLAGEERGFRSESELSPSCHPAMRRVLASFEPCWLGGATGRGAEPSM